MPDSTLNLKSVRIPRKSDLYPLGTNPVQGVMPSKMPAKSSTLFIDRLSSPRAPSAPVMASSLGRRTPRPGRLFGWPLPALVHRDDGVELFVEQPHLVAVARDDRVEFAIEDFRI